MKKEFKLNEEYLYPIIEKYSLDNDLEENEYGVNCVGENFLVLKHQDKDIAISFVMTGWSENGGIFKCIYTDL